MVKCILFENPDGRLSTRGGIGPRMRARFNGDLDAALNYILADLVPVQNPGAINPRIVDYTFPADREFRDAWEDDGAKIDVNLAKAIAIQESRIRGAKLIVARDLNDRETAGENVAGEKVQLRAIDPASVRGAATVDQLKTMWPAQLQRTEVRSLQ